MKTERDERIIGLSGYLPYGTIISVNDGKCRKDVKLHPHYIFDWDADRWDAKPYLRPMSSMTDEEREEYKHLQTNYEFAYFDNAYSIDWLNEHKFDYRGWIEKGWALPAPEGMYC